MEKIYLVFLFLAISIQIVSSSENVTDSKNDENSIQSLSPSSDKLNPTIRNALLQAIDKLEKEVHDDNKNDPEGGEQDNISSDLKSALAGVNLGTDNPNFIPTVQFYTASGEDTNQDISPEGDIILKTFFKNIDHSKESKEDDKDDVKIRFSLTSAINSISSDNIQQTRSVSSSSSNEISEDIKTKVIIPTTIRPKLQTTKRRTTTVPTTTTTKKPAPTHNEDGENIEVVEKNDIKIFKAPLVTAFSVQQDDKGTLKKVVPLFNEVASSSSTTQRPSKPLFGGGAVIEKLKVTASNASNNPLLPNPTPTQSTIALTQPNSLSNEQKGIPVPSFLRPQVLKINSIPFDNNLPVVPPDQLFSAQQSPPLSPVPNTANTEALNNFLLERQRFLEQQIIQLQIQARQQQEQIILQQRFLEEQRRGQPDDLSSGLKTQQSQLGPLLSTSENLQPRTRFFRQENGVSNFGVQNSFIGAESNNRFSSNDFVRPRFGPLLPSNQESQSQNVIFQPALNHGINPFTPRNYQFSSSGQFVGSF